MENGREANLSIFQNQVQDSVSKLQKFADKDHFMPAIVLAELFPGNVFLSGR